MLAICGARSSRGESTGAGGLSASNVVDVGAVKWVSGAESGFFRV